MKETDTGATIRVYTDGAGQRPDGKASGLAWFREDTSEKHVELIDGLTNNVAEYKAVISALRQLPDHINVEIFTDSLLVVSQLSGEYRILDPKLMKLASEVKTIVEQKRLTVKFTWVARAENRAGKLL
ncbi:MAG TPA: RNase H family protein [Candidatus Cybelea sp.]|nr:RNase H family protein [Candidatus Cybelea sp.]